MAAGAGEGISRAGPAAVSMCVCTGVPRNDDGCTCVNVSILHVCSYAHMCWSKSLRIEVLRARPKCVYAHMYV